MTRILITDATSYLNSYIVLYSLEMGLEVRLAVSRERNEAWLTQIENIYSVYSTTPDIYEVDLEDLGQVFRAVQGCDAIIHSLVQDQTTEIDNPSKLTKKSLNEALNLMKAAKRKQIRRIVFSGSATNVYAGKKGNQFDDDHWGDIENMESLQRARLYVEKTVWYQNNQWDEEKRLDLTVLNLGELFGPSIGLRPEHPSNRLVSRLLLGKINQVLKFNIPTIDVRDAALVHLKVLDNKETFNKRINTLEGVHWVKDIAGVLNDEFEQIGYQVSESEIGKFPVTLLRLLDRRYKRKLDRYGKAIRISNERLKEVFKFKFRPLDETIIEMGYDLFEKGIDGGRSDNRSGGDFYDSRRNMSNVHSEWSFFRGFSLDFWSDLIGIDSILVFDFFAIFFSFCEFFDFLTNFLELAPPEINDASKSRMQSLKPPGRESVGSGVESIPNQIEFEKSIDLQEETNTGK